MPSDYQNTTSSTAVTHQAAPGAGEKVCVKSWLVANKSLTDSATCLLLSGSTTKAEVVVPPDSSKEISFGVDQQPVQNNTRARGLECAEAEALKFQQTGGITSVSSTVVFSVEVV